MEDWAKVSLVEPEVSRRNCAENQDLTVHAPVILDAGCLSISSVSCSPIVGRNTSCALGDHIGFAEDKS